MKVKPLLVIPVFDHPATVGEVARRALACHPHLLVVDDGSADPVAPLLEGLELKLLRHERNRGKGAAIMTAARYAAEEGYTHIVTLDADGQHHPEEAQGFFGALEKEPGAIFVGYRDFDTDNVPASSRFGRKFSNFWLRVQTGVKLGDVQCGYRAYPVGVLLGLKLSEPGFAFEVEVLVRAAWAGVALRDLPVGVIYQPPGERVSHFDKLRDNARLTVLNTRLTIRSMVPWRSQGVTADEDGKGASISALHPLRSLALLLSEGSTPGKIAAAAAVGVLIGTLPLFGVQMLTIMALCGYLGLNRVAAVTAGQLCSPPLVPALAIEVGHFLRHGQWLTEISLQTLGYEALERLLEWVIGAVALAPVLALIVGALTWSLAVGVKTGLAKRARG